MAITPGYKQTEVGVIPAEWEVKKIGDVLTIKHGKNQSQVTNTSGMIPIYGSGGIIGWASKYLYDKPSVLIGRKGTIDSPYYMDIPFWTVDTMFYSEIFRNIDAKFIFYTFNTIDWYAYNEASGVPSLNAKTIESISIPLPPLPEQIAIAEVLSDMDALIASTEALINKKRALKQATMQQLLTGQTRLPGFSKIWQNVPLHQLVTIPVTDGPHLTPKFHSDGVPFLSVNNLVDNRIDLSDLRYISKEDDWVFSRKCKPKRGDVLLGKAASVGKVAFVDFDFDFNIWSPIALIRPNDSTDGKFLYYQLHGSDCINQIKLLTNASSQGNIGMGDIEKIMIQLPTLPEQIAIAAVLSDMDAELDALSAQLAKTRALKQGMMQELLTGRTRLIPKPTESASHAE